METLLIRIMLLSELQIIGVMYLLMIGGALLAGLFIRMSWRLRRMTYLASVVAMGLGISVANLGWIMLPYVADAGYMGLVGGASMVAYVLGGAVHYLLAAGRSTHICGDRHMAWWAFIPFLNLALFFTAQQDQLKDGAQGYRLRPVVDFALVLVSLSLFSAGKFIDHKVETWSYAQDVHSDRMARLISEAQSLEQSLAWEAEVSQADLPMRLDDITVLTRVEAEGTVLRIVLAIEDPDMVAFGMGVKQALAEEICDPGKFGYDIGRGGTILYQYVTLGGEELAAFPIAKQDCFH